MKAQSDTPETDAKIADLGDDEYSFCDSYLAMGEFARKLERERDELREVVRAATVLITAKGRYNTQIAFERLKELLK